MDLQIALMEKMKQTAVLFAPMEQHQITVSLTASTHTAHAIHLTTNVKAGAVFLMTCSVTTNLIVPLVRMRKIALSLELTFRRMIHSPFCILKNQDFVRKRLISYHVNLLHSVIIDFQFASMIQLMGKWHIAWMDLTLERGIYVNI